MARQRSSVNRLFLLVCLVLAGCSGTSQWATNAPRQRAGGSDQIACTPSGRDPHRVGVVVLRAAHTFEMGGDRPHGESARFLSIARLTDVLQGAGFQMVVPEMPWSEEHPYDRSFTEALDSVAAAVATLRAQGAERVVVVGHSLGGGAVIGFGACAAALTASWRWPRVPIQVRRFNGGNGPTVSPRPRPCWRRARPTTSRRSRTSTGHIEASYARRPRTTSASLAPTAKCRCTAILRIGRPGCRSCGSTAATRRASRGASAWSAADCGPSR